MIISKAIDFSTINKTASKLPAPSKIISGRSSSEMREAKRLDHPYEKFRFHESWELQYK